MNPFIHYLVGFGLVIVPPGVLIYYNVVSRRLQRAAIARRRRRDASNVARAEITAYQRVRPA